MGVNWDIIFMKRNCFIPCIIFLIILIILFIKYREVTFFLGICMALIATFTFSPWGEDANSMTKIILLIILLILGVMIRWLVNDKK